MYSHEKGQQDSMMVKGRRVHTDQHPNRLPYHPHHIQFLIGHEILGRPIWPGRPSKFGRARTLPGNGWVNATDVRMGKHARVLPIFIDRSNLYVFVFQASICAPHNVHNMSYTLIEGEGATSCLCDHCQHVLLTISGPHVDMSTKRLRCPFGCL